MRLTHSAAADRDPPVLEAPEGHDREQPEGHLPGHEAEPATAAMPRRADGDPHGHHRADHEGRRHEGDHPHPSGPPHCRGFERRRRTHPHDQPVGQAHAECRADQQPAHELQHRLHPDRGRRHPPHGQEGDLAPTAVTPEQGRGGHQTGTGEGGEDRYRPDPAADRGLDAASPVGHERHRGLEVALDEPIRVRRLDLLAAQRPGTVVLGDLGPVAAPRQLGRNRTVALEIRHEVPGGGHGDLIPQRRLPAGFHHLGHRGRLEVQPRLPIGDQDRRRRLEVGALQEQIRPVGAPERVGDGAGRKVPVHARDRGPDASHDRFGAGSDAGQRHRPVAHPHAL